MLACDGIWDCVSNQECVDRCKSFYDQKNCSPDKSNLALVVEGLFEEIIAPNTDDGIGTDNMTAIWIKLDSTKVTKNDWATKWASLKISLRLKIQ